MEAGTLFTPRPPAVEYAASGVAPPSALYIFPGEQLVVDTWSSMSPAPIRIYARVLTPRGEIQTSAWTHKPNTNRTRATSYHDLAEGFLLALTIEAPGLAYRRGHCWCLATLQRGRGAVGQAQHLLIADYVTGTGRLVWPGGQIRSSVDGPGLIRSVTGTDPPAGTEIIEAVPGGARWRFMALIARLDTSSTVANRLARLLFDDGTNPVGRFHASVVQPASALWFYTWSAGGLTAENVGGEVAITVLSLPLLCPGWHIRTETLNLQESDNWTTPQLWVEEWIEP